MIERRVADLRSVLTQRGYDALVISQPDNRRFMSGFTGSAGVLVITPYHAILLTDFRYVEQATIQAPQFEVMQMSNGYGGNLAAVLAELQAKTVGFEAEHVSVAEFARWQGKSPDVAWQPAEGTIESLRRVKTPEELDAIRRAVRISDDALEHVLRTLCPGVSEQQLAWELETYMRSHGAEGIAFDLIVGAGPNAAMPHHRSGDHPIRAGEPIIIDLGAVVDGYHSDLTRTVCLGQPDGRFVLVHELVLRAQLAAEAGLRPGMSGQEADAIARKIITEAGYADQFQHSLGHGVGLAIHEGPRLSTTSTDVLEPGMVVTVEPGVYVPGWGGVRIEDLVVITEDGCEVLTHVDKEWVLIDREQSAIRT